MLAIGERVRPSRQRVGVDARPDDVPVGAAFLLVLDDKPRLTLKSQMAFQRVYCLRPLRVSEMFFFAGIDIRVIKI
jgi:hypothetical protein